MPLSDNCITVALLLVFTHLLALLLGDVNHLLPGAHLSLLLLTREWESKISSLFLFLLPTFSAFVVSQVFFHPQILFDGTFACVMPSLSLWISSSCLLLFFCFTFFPPLPTFTLPFSARIIWVQLFDLNEKRRRKKAPERKTKNYDICWKSSSSPFTLWLEASETFFFISLFSVICHPPFYETTLCNYESTFPSVSLLCTVFLSLYLSTCLVFLFNFFVFTFTENQMLLDEQAELYCMKALLDMHKLNYHTICVPNAEWMSPNGKLTRFSHQRIPRFLHIHKKVE